MKGETMEKSRFEIAHYYKKGGFNHLINVSVDNDLFAALTFTQAEMAQILNDYPDAKGNLFALVDGVEIKLRN